MTYRKFNYWVIGLLVVQTTLFAACLVMLKWNVIALLILLPAFLLLSCVEIFAFCQSKTDIIPLSPHLNSFDFFDEEELQEKKYELDDKSKMLLECCKKIEELSTLMPTNNENIKRLEIPVPDNPKENELPYKSYVNTLQNLPSNIPIMIGFEQFILSIRPKEELIDFIHSLMESLKDNTSEFLKNSYNDLCDFLANAAHNLTLQNPDFVNDLFSNFWNALLKHFESVFDFYHLSQDILTQGFLKGLVNVVSNDACKSFIKTLFDNDGVIMDNFKTHISDLGDNLRDTFTENIPDLDIFQPEFDFSFHFPYISAVVEAYNEIDRLKSDKTDTRTAIKNYGIRIGFKTYGMYVGGVIGSFVPVIGSFVGAIIGGIISTKIANKIIRQDYDAAVEEFNNAIEAFNRIRSNVQKELADKQVRVDREIRKTAKEEKENFKKIKSHCPLSDDTPINTIYSVDIVIKDYLVDLYYRCLKVFKQKGLLKNNNRSIESLSCKRLLQQLGRTISTVSYVENDCIKNIEKLLLIKPVIETNQPLFEKYGIMQKYFVYNDVIAICTDYMEMAKNRYNIILIVWYTQIYMSYRNSINRIVEKTNMEFKSLQLLFEVNQEILVKEHKKLDPKKEKVERERDKIA